MLNTGYTPTPEEIRERCLEIQAEWCERERRSRIADDRIAKVRHWKPPLIRADAGMMDRLTA